MKFITFVDWDTSCMYTTLGWGIQGLKKYLNTEIQTYRYKDLLNKKIKVDKSDDIILVFEIGNPQHAGVETYQLKECFPNAKLVALCADTQYYQFNNLEPQMNPDGIDLHLEISLSGVDWLKSKGAKADWWHWGISEKLIEMAEDYKNNIADNNKEFDFIGVYHPNSINNQDGWRYSAIKYIQDNGYTFTRGGSSGDAHKDHDLLRLFSHFNKSRFSLGTTSHNRPEITRQQSAKFFRDELGPLLGCLLIYNDCELVRKIYEDGLVPFYDYDDNKTILDVYNQYINTDKYNELLTKQVAWVKEHSFERELVLKLLEHNIISVNSIKRNRVYAADREYGFTRIINEKGYKVGIEIGVRHGKYSAWLLEHTSLNKLYSLDMFPYPDMLQLTVHNLSPYPYRSEIIYGRTPEQSVFFEDNYFDFIYIDANHTYDGVKADLEAWWPKLKDGGMFCGDDYTHLVNPGEGKYGVVEAVNEFVEKYNLKLYISGTEIHSKQEHNRIAVGYGKIIEGLLHEKINIKIGDLDNDDIRVPQWFVFK